MVKVAWFVIRVSSIQVLTTITTEAAFILAVRIKQTVTAEVFITMVVATPSIVAVYFIAEQELSIVEAINEVVVAIMEVFVEVVTQEEQLVIKVMSFIVVIFMEDY